MMLDTLIIGGLALLNILLAILLIVEHKKKKKILKFVVDQEVRYSEMQKSLKAIMEEQQTKEIEKSDGFLKFVSESRDWAFSYIEDVQSKLSEFDKRMDGIVEYYSIYGPEIEGLHIDLLNKVSEAYQDLKSALPKE